MDLLIWLTWELFGKIHRPILLQETFFARLGGGGGGVTQERFSNFSNNRFFSSREITGKTLSARKNIIGNVTKAKHVV